MFGADRCFLAFDFGARLTLPSRISSSSLASIEIALSSRKDPLRLALRILLPVELIERLEFGRIIISTSLES